MINKVPNILFLMVLFSCSGKNTKPDVSYVDSITVSVNSNAVSTAGYVEIGEEINGDFDGKGNGLATVKKVKEGEGNPIDDDNATADEYIVAFSGNDIAAIPIGCCDAILVLEGDLNGDGADEFSVFQAPMNGCTYYWKTFTYKTGEWKELFESYLLPTGCDGLSVEELLNMVVREDGNIYYYERDPNDGNLVKKNAILK